MNSDERIVELQEQIALKREQLGDEPTPGLIVDDLLKMGDGSMTDLCTMPQDVATSLLVDLNSRRLSANDLGISYHVGDFPVEDWIKDIQARLAHLEYKQERRRLEHLESKLERLLSQESKKARAIEAIAGEIQGSDD